MTEEQREKMLLRKRRYNKAHREERRIYKLEHYQGITPATRRSLNKWKENNKEKVYAHKKVYIAIKLGKIKREPCEICGETERVQAHHEDYSQPLDVIWLCRKHHAWIHM